MLKYVTPHNNFWKINTVRVISFQRKIIDPRNHLNVSQYQN